MLHSLEVEENGKTEKYICAHWRVFPPPGAGEDAENLRVNKAIDDAQYNRLKLWERICGLTKMAESKCMSCPHRRRIAWRTQGPVLVSPDGVEAPVVDAATGESSPKHRHLNTIFRRPGTRGSHEPAAWTKGDQDG
jgi:hypothetical protein